MQNIDVFRIFFVSIPAVISLRDYKDLLNIIYLLVGVWPVGKREYIFAKIRGHRRTEFINLLIHSFI